MTPTLLNNRYRILRTIGRGGFGETFLAEDTHMPSGRRCVIKQLKPAAPDPQSFQLAQQRFQREAAILEELGEGSSQIPKLYAYFSEDGQFYLVEEWIEGQTLTNKVQQQGPLPESSVRQILISLLPVLDYVHSHWMIHRDIKPDNIILRQRDGMPVLIDFGAVKQAVEAAINYAANTPASIMIGTPGFMPSEQAAGRPLYPSDLYSLGLTAIYLLTEKLPQQLETDPQTGDLLWHQYAVNVSPNLKELLDKAIRSHSRDRFSSAKEMLNALQSGTPTQTQYLTAQINPAPSAIATKAVIPSNQPPVNPSPQVAPTPTAVVGGSTIPKRQPKPWMIGVLVAGGLLAVALILNALLRRDPQPSPIASSGADSEQTTPQSTSTPEPINSPSEIAKETQPPDVVGSQSPEAINPPAPTNPPAPEVTPTTASTPTPDITPTTASKPAPRAVESSAPETEPAPEPRSNSRDNQNTNRSTDVPAFPVGTTRDSIEAALGKPTGDYRGIYKNTRAVIYKMVPNKIELGYIFDRNSGVLRQTEVAFAQSVDAQVMQNTLNGMLKGSANDDIRQGLEQVQERRKDHHYFSQGSFKGMIVRQNCDLIYISVWERDLHDHESVSSNKKC